MRIRITLLYKGEIKEVPDWMSNILKDSKVRLSRLTILGEEDEN